MLVLACLHVGLGLGAEEDTLSLVQVGLQNFQKERAPLGPVSFADSVAQSGSLGAEAAANSVAHSEAVEIDASLAARGMFGTEAEAQLKSLQQEESSHMTEAQEAQVAKARAGTKALSFQTSRLVGMAKQYIQSQIEQYVTSIGQPILNDTSSFISTNGLFCVEGPPRAAEGALALKKAGVQGALYSESYAMSGKKCTDHGFSLIGGPDTCHPGLTTYFKDRAGHVAFLEAETQALENYRAQYSLPAQQVNLMAACMCHPDSSVMHFAAGHCSLLEGLTGALVHRNPNTGSELTCSEGPLQRSAFVLAMLKSSAQLPMHLLDQIVPMSCSELGFTVQSATADHCLTGMHTWTHGPASTDKGAEDFATFEQDLFGGGFESWAKGKGLDSATLMSVPGCQCLPGSETAVQLSTLCKSPEARPPVGDWLQA